MKYTRNRPEAEWLRLLELCRAQQYVAAISESFPIKQVIEIAILSDSYEQGRQLRDLWNMDITRCRSNFEHLITSQAIRQRCFNFAEGWVRPIDNLVTSDNIVEMTSKLPRLAVALAVSQHESVVRKVMVELYLNHSYFDLFCVLVTACPRAFLQLGYISQSLADKLRRCRHIPDFVKKRLKVSRQTVSLMDGVEEFSAEHLKSSPLLYADLVREEASQEDWYTALDREFVPDEFFLGGPATLKPYPHFPINVMTTYLVVPPTPDIAPVFKAIVEHPKASLMEFWIRYHRVLLPHEHEELLVKMLGENLGEYAAEWDFTPSLSHAWFHLFHSVPTDIVFACS
jgi:hypothetical protein